MPNNIILILGYLNPSPRRGLAKLQEHYLVNKGYLAYSDLPQITEPAATATAKGMPTKALTPPIKIEDYYNYQNRRNLKYSCGHNTEAFNFKPMNII